jgi:MoxR-like ATPase
MTDEKSCLNCPAMIRTEKVAEYFGKSTGTPMCGIYGKPIGKASSNTSNIGQIKQIAKDLAKNCPSYGEHAPIQPNWNRIKMEIVFPDPEALANTAVDPLNPTVRSCSSCKWFVRDDAVLEQLGFGMPLCKAHGKLIPPIMMREYAKTCEQREVGLQVTDLSGVTFLPVYENAFFDPTDPVQVFERSQAAGVVEPSTYPSDKEVTQVEHQNGIRAWRKITDPVTDNHVMLPIFRRDFFSPEQQVKIPTTGNDEHPEDYVDHGQYVYKIAVLWLHLDETPALWGRAGTGKSELFRHMAWLMQLPFERFSITGSSELDDLAGKMHYTEGTGTHFEDGRLVKAWASPAVVLVDEPNTGPPDVWQFLRPLIDNSKQLVLDMDNGRHVKRNDDCYMGMAMNPAWDMLNVGTNMLGDADANRLMHLQVDLPPRELEERIIRDRCNHDGWKIPDEKLKMVMGIAADIREACDNDTLPISWAIRPQLKVARALRWFDPMTAYRMASADYLDPSQQQILLDLVKGHIATDLPF